MSTAMRAGYKQSDVGLIPNDWELVALGEIASTSSGTTPARDLADRYYRNGTVHWVKTLDLKNSDLADTDELVTLTAVDETSLRPYPVGTVLVAMYGGFNQIGRTGLLRIPAAVNQAITAIQPRATKLQPEYLLATLNFRVDYWKTVASSSRKDPNITSQDVRAFPIAFPQLPEQRAIATALSDVDALLAKLDALVAKKRDLKVAAMQQLITGQTRLPGFSGEWEVKRLGDIADPNQNWSFTGGPFGSNLKSSDYTEEGVRIIQLQNIGDGVFHDDYAIFTSLSKANELLSCNVYPGEILLSKMGDPVARACLVPSTDSRYLMCSDGIRLAVDPKRFNTQFVFYQINSADFRTRADSAGTGSTRKRIGLTELRNLQLTCPSLVEQTAIATILSDMDSELAAVEARLDKTRALKQGMMQELLTGRIRLIDTQVTTAKQSEQKSAEAEQPHSWAFNEAVVIAVLADQFGKPEFPLGRMRYTKLAYLMHRKAENDAQGYLKKKAGPYNPQTRYAGPEKIAQQNGYVRAHSNGKFKGWVGADKIEQAKNYFTRWYGPELTGWLEQFRYTSNDGLERLATVDMAMKELAQQGKPVDLNAVRTLIESEPEWAPKLTREVFSDDGIAAAMAECRKLFSG